MKRFLSWLLIPTTAVILMLLLAPFTDLGTRILFSVFSAAGRLTPVEIRYTSGSLFGTLQLSSIGFETESVEIELNEITLQMEMSCLWRSKFCFENMRAEHLEIKLTSQDTPVSETEKDVVRELIVFPYGLTVDRLQVDRTDIYWQTGRWSHGLSHTSVRINGSQVIVTDSYAENAFLELTNLLPNEIPRSKKIGLPVLDIPIELIVENLRLEQSGWNLYGKQGQLETLGLVGSWKNRDLQIEQLETVTPQFGNIDLSGTMQFTGDWPLSLRATGQTTQPPIWTEFHNLPFELELSGDLAHMAIRLQAAGSRKIDLQGIINTLDRALPFELAATADWQNSLPLKNIPGVPDNLPDIDLVSPWNLSANGTTQSQHFNLQTSLTLPGHENLRLTTEGRHEPSKLVIQQARLKDASNENVLDLSGQLITKEQLSWTLNAKTAGFNIPAFDPRVSGRIAGGFQMNGSAGEEDWMLAFDDLSINGEVNDLPLSIEGHLTSRSDRYISSANLSAELNGAKLILEGSDEIHASLNVSDLGLWFGTGSGVLAFNGLFSQKEQMLLLNGTADNLVWQQLIIEQSVIKGDYKLDGEQPFSLDLQMDGIEQGEQRLGQLNIVATGDRQNQSVRLKSQGKLEAELALTGQYSPTGWVGELLPNILTTPLGSWQLKESVAVDWVADEQQFTLAPHCWVGLDVQLCPGKTVLGESGKISFDLSGDIGFIQGLLPTGFELLGGVELSLLAHWSTNQNPVVKGSVALQAGELSQTLEEPGESAKLHWQSAQANFSYQLNQLNLDGDLRLQGDKGILVQLMLPGDKQRELSGQLTANQLDLSLLRPFITSLSDIQGELDGSIKLSGTGAQPKGYGALRLTNGQLKAVANPTTLTAANLSIDMQGDKALITGDALLGGGGLDINGQLVLSPVWRMVLNLNGRHHDILMPPVTALNASEKIQLIATSELFEIKGDLTIHEGLMEPDQLPAGSVALSSDVVVMDDRSAARQQAARQKLGIDLNIRIEDRFKLIGDQIDVVGGGNLHLIQKPQYPMELYGKLAVSRGELYAYGQSLHVSQGELDFVGEPDNPRLNVRSERDISGENVTVGMEILGTAKAPEINIYSRPDMSQAEAISYLVRGRGLDSGTTPDGSDMALSMGATVLNSSGILAPLNEIPGIRDIELAIEGTADETTATIGGYVGERIYLSYGVGVYEPIQVVISRLYLRNSLWVEVVSSLENSMDLYYSFDID
ncbi:MAG: translocation/assembly module TamB domain-containing protein [Pseudomonadales bacterium]|nr:translocation/assembly module TamB domain-containing protein [Pseudomonadales bacterium]